MLITLLTGMLISASAALCLLLQPIPLPPEGTHLPFRQIPPPPLIVNHPTLCRGHIRQRYLHSAVGDTVLGAEFVAVVAVQEDALRTPPLHGIPARERSGHPCVTIYTSDAA